MVVIISCLYKGEEIYVGEQCPGEGWVQDEDVLDTWFSSALCRFQLLDGEYGGPTVKTIFPN